MPTKQETFNVVYLALKKQGSKCVIDNLDGCGQVCVYRGPNGMKCAAGHLIPDNLYKPEFEEEGGQSVTTVDSGNRPVNEVSKIINALGHDLYLVSRLQSAHDGCGNDSRNMLQRLENVADQFNLEVPTT